MTDIYSSAKRSSIMSKISGKNTKPELIVRSLLHKHGYRFRLHRKDLPGKPDICLPRYKTVIFVHGCYWHRHNNCKKGRSMPSTNQDFWQDKFKKTIARDKLNQAELRNRGWKVLVIWECQINDNIEELIDKIEG
jgi:DNA mismatch endonuclease (patch repair protein)